MFAILLSLIIGYTLHAKDVFQPPKPPSAEKWSEALPRRETLEFQTTEGIKMRGWLYRTDAPAAPLVIFFYGSNEDLMHEANRLAWLSDAMHVNAVCFDYPGYGFSGGSVDVAAIQSAAVQEFDFVRKRRTPDTDAPVVAYGWSIGTGIAVHVAAERQVAGLILQAPPASADEMMRWSSKHDVPWYGRGVVKMKADPDIEQVYENASAIRTISTPLLIIQGQLDDVVPIAQGRRVFEASPAAHKQFVEVPGVHHNDLRFTQPPASDAVDHFIQSLH